MIPSHNQHRMTAAELADRLDAKPAGRGSWIARCPAHDDRDPSLSITEGDDRTLIHCHGGCSPAAVCAALGLSLSDLMPPGEGSGRNGRGRGVVNPRRNAATVQHSDSGAGCTLAQYAERKKLPEDFLRSLGLTDLSYKSRPAVGIPYRRGDGTEGPVRFRVRLHKVEDGDGRYAWRKGSKLEPYGLDRLDAARKAACVLLVEGESDCHTLWHHGVPALGLPGASSWKDAWAEHLDGIETVYLLVEPDQGGETLQAAMGKSPIRDRLRLVSLDGFEDPSELHISNPNGFTAALQAALDRSIAWTDVARKIADEAARTAWAECREIAAAPDILDRLAAFVAENGVAGEERLVKLLYLAVTTRLLERPVSVAVKGPSSGGKSFVVERVLAMFPETAYHALTAMSERALAYSEEPLAHRMLVIYEAGGMAGDMASYLMRSLLSEGRIRYELVEKTKDGMKPRLIEREGPTGLIVTTTATRLHPENETRLLSVTVSDTPEQTRRILFAATRPPADPADAHRWVAFQEWLGRQQADVLIPYAEALAKAIPPVAVRLRRDFPTVLSLIRAHALLHRVSRHRDGAGCIVANLEDYRVVRDLVEDLISEGVARTVKPEVREAVETVASLATQQGQTVTNAAVARELDLDPSATSRRLRGAADAGYVVNEESRRGKPAAYRIGEPMPDERDVLPKPEVLHDCTMDGEVEHPLPLSDDIDEPLDVDPFA